MGLKMTLGKEHNSLYFDFVDAYWIIKDIHYSTTSVGFALECHPSREASHKALEEIPERSIGVGGAVKSIYDPLLYSWYGEFPTRDVFPTGIPLDEDMQKQVLYEWIKVYTRLPFEDVFEE